MTEFIPGPNGEMVEVTTRPIKGFISLRDAIAIRAMEAIIAKGIAGMDETGDDPEFDKEYEAAARGAYAYADAMLKVRGER